MQRNLETVIQSKVSQKEKNKYRLLKHLCGIQKNGIFFHCLVPESCLANGIDDLICKTGIETQWQRANIQTIRGGRKGGMYWNWVDIYTLLMLCIKQITNENLLSITGNSSQCSEVTLKWEGNPKRRGHMCMYN